MILGRITLIPLFFSASGLSSKSSVIIHHETNILTVFCSGGRPVESCRTLTESEKPTPGTPVALDTEFVDLEKAEIDVKADGSQEIVRPSRSGLARVSVLRGIGVQEGTPFIDDYITIKEPIVDYVTQYSGIKPNDLDLRTSEHNLVPLKIAYKKLWLLLNLGCVFVGHGLPLTSGRLTFRSRRTRQWIRSTFTSTPPKTDVSVFGIWPGPYSRNTSKKNPQTPPKATTQSKTPAWLSGSGKNSRNTKTQASSLKSWKKSSAKDPNWASDLLPGMVRPPFSLVPVPRSRCKRPAAEIPLIIMGLDLIPRHRPAHQRLLARDSVERLL